MTRIDLALLVIFNLEKKLYLQSDISHEYKNSYLSGLILAKRGYPEEFILAGMLSKYVQDSYLSLEYITEEFGSEVADLLAKENQYPVNVHYN